MVGTFRILCFTCAKLRFTSANDFRLPLRRRCILAAFLLAARALVWLQDVRKTGKRDRRALKIMAVKTFFPSLGKPAMEFVDRVLKCSDCGAEFVFTAGEQLFFHDKQFKNDPKHC